MTEQRPANKLAWFAAVGTAAAVAAAIALYVTRDGGGLGVLDSVLHEQMVVPEQVRMARVQMAQLGNALQMYRLDTGSYPSTATGLLALVADGAVTEGELRDPWGTVFVYGVTPDGNFELRSAGPNAIPGDEDDVLQP